MDFGTQAQSGLKIGEGRVPPLLKLYKSRYDILFDRDRKGFHNLK